MVVKPEFANSELTFLIGDEIDLKNFDAHLLLDSVSIN